MAFSHLFLYPFRQKMVALLSNIMAIIAYIPRLVWISHHIVKLNRLEWIPEVIVCADHQMCFGSYRALDCVESVIPDEIIPVNTRIPLNVIFK